MKNKISILSFCLICLATVASAQQKVKQANLSSVQVNQKINTASAKSSEKISKTPIVHKAIPSTSSAKRISVSDVRKNPSNLRQVNSTPAKTLPTKNNK